MDKRILLIDDDQMNLTLNKKRLEKRGFNCDAETSALPFLEKFEKGELEYDLILLDIMMPDISGIEVLEKIRAKKNKLELPVIMVTSKDEVEDIVDALKKGASDYVTKPVNIDIAQARIDTQLQLGDLVRLSNESEQMSTIAKMVTTLNHEINNPLAIAIGNLTISKEKLDLVGVEKALGALDRITEIVKRIEILTEGNAEEIKYSTNSNMYKLK